MANKINDPDALDPNKVDVVSSPRKRRAKPKLRKKAKHCFPDKQETAAIRERLHETRPISPGIMLEPHADGGYTYESPHDDEAEWEVQICAAFGTRSWSTMQTFIRHLKGLVGETYDRKLERWKPNERELNALLNIVNGVRPDNEMQAMLAAQMCAIHLLQMSAASYALRGGGTWIDPKEAGSASMLSRTFVQLSDCLHRQKAKPRRTTRQKIEVHHHTHQHIHVEQQGASGPIGGQSHEHMGQGTSGNNGIPQVRRSDTGGNVLLLPGNAGEVALPPARVRGRTSRTG